MVSRLEFLGKGARHLLMDAADLVFRIVRILELLFAVATNTKTTPQDLDVKLAGDGGK